jgi:hypothetical protein
MLVVWKLGVEMNISRKSWHYKIIKIWGASPNNLCEYFWTLIICCILSILASIIILISSPAFFPIYGIIKCIEFLNELNISDNVKAKLWYVLYLSCIVFGFFILFVGWPIVATYFLEEDGGSISGIVLSTSCIIIFAILLYTILSYKVLYEGLINWQDAYMISELNKPYNNASLSFSNNVFLAWVKAKKQKVCPLIKYTD